MGKWVHVTDSIDVSAGTLVCTNCGTVPIHWETRNGKTVPRCSEARVKRKRVRDKSNDLSSAGHGLTYAEVKARIEAAKCCKLCGSTERLVNDHCHTTLKLRDVLCFKCNFGLGFFNDDPDVLRAAAEYIEFHRG